jgi:hypothetical protein
VLLLSIESTSFLTASCHPFDFMASRNDIGSSKISEK